MDADFEEAEKNHIGAHCLTNFATVVDLLLEYLTSKQLCAAACVCWFWNVSAKRIKSKRKKVLTKLIGIPEEDEDECSMDSIANSLEHFVNNARIQPLAAVLYVNRSADYFESKLHQKSIKRAIKEVFAALPPGSPLVGCLGGGVIGCNDQKSEELEQTESASLLLLPSHDGVDISHFFLTLTDIRKSSADLDLFKDLVGWQKNPDTKVILLHACCESEDIVKAITLFVKVFGDEIIIAGGQAESIFYNQKVRARGISCICFSGNVCASIAVHKDRNCVLVPSRNKMLPCLEKLKESSQQLLQQQGNSVIFMYSCVARGFGLYAEPNTETDWISEVFPRVPVVGMFAFGEIGYDPHLTDEYYSGRESPLHSYTTVLCHLKFGMS